MSNETPTSDIAETDREAIDAGLTPSAAARPGTRGADHGKRTLSGGDHAPVQRRKMVKVTRACDTCKQRKSRCSGTLPCDTCRKRGHSANCQYDAEYRRGQLVTPLQLPPATPQLGTEGARQTACSGNARHQSSIMETTANVEVDTTNQSQELESSPGPVNLEIPLEHGAAAPSRASPELDVAEIQGQYVDTTSGLAFLHRAFRRLSKNGGVQMTRPLPDMTGDYENEDSPTLTVGDKPIGAVRQADVELPSLQRAKELVHLYFDVCIATYRCLHLQTVEGWLETMLRNEHDHLPIHHRLGRAKAAIALTILAIATAHEEKATGRFQEDEVRSMKRTDSLYSIASALIQQETARPTLESAQARIIQVLFLLTTSRMNQAWYTFGTAFQLISALGLHRKAGKQRSEGPKNDYITKQCRRRTFWTAYVLDKYLGVIFGRPRHYNDDEIDQEMPDSINDEDMTLDGPKHSQRRIRKDCHIDALIYHTRIAAIISEAAKTVYSIKKIPLQDRIAAANQLNKQLQQWRRSLPAHLGSIAPSSLIPRFRRQATTLKIAYCHAIMHINRLFLLGPVSAGSETQIREAMLAANTVLETVDEMVSEGGTIFHAFWWSHYVTFCALAIVYAWKIQSRTTRLDPFPDNVIDHSELMELAERCQRHLAKATASNSPSRRYALILDKLRREVTRNNLSINQVIIADDAPRKNATCTTHEPLAPSISRIEGSNTATQHFGQDLVARSPYVFTDPPLDEMNWSIQDWQSEDWLNLDSMAFGTFPDSNDAPFVWEGQ